MLIIQCNEDCGFCFLIYGCLWVLASTLVLDHLDMTCSPDDILNVTVDIMMLVYLGVVEQLLGTHVMCQSTIEVK